MEFALRLADHYAIVDAGHVVAAGPTDSQEDGEVRQLLSV
jgi:ABC-type branched-subunit amino acid transport system ATPase component